MKEFSTKSARKYIDKMVDNYTRMFKKPPKKFSSPLEKVITQSLMIPGD
jgi:hypothetical protein